MFKLIKEIKSKTGELHFRRWNLLTTPWFNIYLHCIYKPDEDKHLHDHPWNFIGIILSGAYIEEVSLINDESFLKTVHAKNLPTKKRFRHPLDIVNRKDYIPHKILHILTSKPVWTLNFTSKRTRDWGYIGDNGWINHKDYRKQKNENKLFPGCINL